MKRVAWVVLAIVAIVLVLAGALALKKYAVPALARAGETTRANIEARLLEARKSQPQPFAVPSVNEPPTRAEPQKAANRKEAAAPERSRERAERERRRAGDPTPRVETIVGATDNRRWALIGEALVREGGTVQGYRVRKINADSVEFEKDGKVWVQKVD